MFSLCLQQMTVELFVMCLILLSLSRKPLSAQKSKTSNLSRVGLVWLTVYLINLWNKVFSKRKIIISVNNENKNTCLQKNSKLLVVFVSKQQRTTKFPAAFLLTRNTQRTRVGNVVLSSDDQLQDQVNLSVSFDRSFCLLFIHIQRISQRKHSFYSV